MLSYNSIQSIPYMLNGWHVCWVFKPWKNWDIFIFQELCTDPYDMGLWIVMLKHEVMAADEADGTTICLNISSRYLCAFKLPSIKMQLCSMSVAYAFPHHNPTPPWGTLFTTLTSANHSPYTLMKYVTNTLHLYFWSVYIKRRLLMCMPIFQIHFCTFECCSNRTLA
jgi:hypothetical protein